ncbi:MAG: hypothetical protein II713_04360 [Clostridia bacterium]|nr:hypothetical protein [Clostridia bacterium]
MKKIIAVLLALALVFALAACGEEAPKTPEDVKGETVDAGKFTVLVPNGWKSFTSSDLFDEYEGDTDPTKLNIYRGAKSEWDQFSKPGLQITYYGPNNHFYKPSKDYYDDAQDVAPIEIGGRKWEGFTADSLGTKICVLSTGDDPDGDQFCANIWLDMSGEGKDVLTPDDPAVIAILGSIKVN